MLEHSSEGLGSVYTHEIVSQSRFGIIPVSLCRPLASILLLTTPGQFYLFSNFI
jgi:hypothetical protein